jgi:hypothetical protein
VFERTKLCLATAFGFFVSVSSCYVTGCGGHNYQRYKATTDKAVDQTNSIFVGLFNNSFAVTYVIDCQVIWQIRKEVMLLLVSCPMDTLPKFIPSDCA